MLVYIMGSGRSGTTALDILLGNQISCFSMGEIRKFFDENGTAVGREAGREASQAGEETVEFWERIYAATSQEHKDLYLKNRFSSKEYHLHLPLTLLASKLFPSGLRLYGMIWNTLFERVRHVTGKTVLVDSSKYPGRALMLESALDDMAVVYIVRKRRDVIRSFKKSNVEQPSKGTVAANLYYCLNRLACSAVFLFFRGKKIRVGFEALQTAPETLVLAICSALGLEHDPRILDDVRNRRPISTGHLFDGNRLRLNDSVVLGGNDRNP